MWCVILREAEMSAPDAKRLTQVPYLLQQTHNLSNTHTLFSCLMSISNGLYWHSSRKALV